MCRLAEWTVNHRGSLSFSMISSFPKSTFTVLVLLLASVFALGRADSLSSEGDFALINQADLVEGIFRPGHIAAPYVDFCVDSGASTNATHHKWVVPMLSPSNVTVEDANGRVVTA